MPVEGQPSMAFHTQQMVQALDPNNSGRRLDMWIVWDTEPFPGGSVAPRQVAYCSHQEDAERIKALLVLYGDRLPLGSGANGS